MRTGEQLLKQGSRDLTRWQKTGRIQHLEGAIEALRQARYLPWRYPEAFGLCLITTVDALEKHSKARPESEEPDTDQLIEVLTALLPLEEGGVGESGARHQRGWYLMHRYLSRRSFSDLNEAVLDFKKALAKTAPENPVLYRRALNIAWACEERYDLTRSRGQDYRHMVYDDPSVNFHLDLTGPYDLVHPIVLLEPLLVHNPERPPVPPLELPAIKRNLANLWVKYAVHVQVGRSAEERLADLDRAIDLLEQALDESAQDPQLQVTIVGSLEAALSTRLMTRDGHPLAPDRSVGKPRDLDRSIARLEQLVATPTHPEITARLQLALAALLLSRHHPGDEDEAVGLYRALTAEPGPASAAISLGAALNWATYELSQERWQDVVEANRHGNLRVRSLMASQDDWLNRYRWTQQAGRLAAFAAYAYIKLGEPANAVAALESGRALMITAQTATPVDELNRAPENVQFVYVLYSDEDAVALCSLDGGAWIAQQLPGFLPVDQLRRYIAALDAFHRDPGSSGDAFYPAVADVLSHFQEALSGLPTTSANDADLVVIPVGALTLFPVAAAFPHNLHAERAVSVLPTGGLLRRKSRGDTPTDSLLVVRDRGLPASGYEERIAKRFFPNAMSFPPDSSKAALLEALPAGGVVHFACHAEAKPGAPLASGILLPNGETLTVHDLVGATLPPLRLAVLSACETGVVDPDTPDEAVSLAAILLASGTDGVVCTLWPVEDLSTTLLIAHFYWEWRTNGTRPPLALARAQRWQAASTDGEKGSFIKVLTQAGLLSTEDSDDLVEDLTLRSRSPSANTFGDPYFWAGFVYSGC
jgi:CHAT domain